MLQRSLSRALRAHPSPPLPSISPSTCHVCTCRCGASLNAPTNTRVPTARPYATKRQSPVTFNREQQRRHDPGHTKSHEQQAQARQRILWQDLQNVGRITIELDAVFEFVDKVIALVNKTGRYSADPVRFRALLQEYNIDMSECWYIWKAMLANADDPKRNANVRKLIFTLSRAGSVPATMRIMHEALMQHKARGVALKSSEIQYARAHLQYLANENYDNRAMVLEGKVALALGDEERAIDLWTRAMKVSIEAAEQDAAQKRLTPDPLELSSPWIELAQLHYQRSQQGKNEMEKCVWAVEIGCELDDPWAHYQATNFTKRVTDDGTHIPTADWLYHMTKAATSNHQKAIHDLAVFYAESGWKYIEDEPPEHVKPTPFDSYPGNSVKLKSIWRSAMTFLGYNTSTKPSLKDQFYQSAVFPSTAADRCQLALQWLEINHNYYYAPSYLFSARMLMREKLWGGADAPKSALQLDNSRYTYASKTDFENDNPIPQDPAPEPEDPPNPFYDLEKAKLHLREVFYAYEVHRMIARNKQSYAQMRRQGLIKSVTDEDDLIDSWRWPKQFRKWLDYPQVREMYEDEMEGLAAEAREICDEQGWDIVDDDGGLVYRAKILKEKNLGR